MPACRAHPPEVALAADVARAAAGLCDPPRFKSGLVARPALVQRLMAATDSKVVVIVAPPGYGKTTLLAEWTAADERPFIWIKPGQAGSIRRMMRTLEREEPRVVLVLDDAHLAAPAVLRDVSTELIDRLPEGSQLVLASRAEPPLPLGQLRAYRVLAEVREDDLMMDSSAAETLLTAAGLELDAGEVGTLVRETEGWPVGLYLAALALKERDELGDRAMSFSRDHHVVSEYLRDEFLTDLTAEDRDFLIRTSVLNVLSAPLCDAVRGATGSGYIIDRLARRKLMLLPVDDRHQDFRVHRLFRATLRAELRRTEPEIEPQLHRRASAWLRRSGNLDAAIAHAVRSGDVQLAGDLLWRHVANYLGHGRGSEVQEWIAGFTSEQIAGCPPLALAAAHSYLMCGEIAEARGWAIVAAEHQRDGRSLAPPVFEAAVATVEAAATTEASELKQTVGRAYALEPEDSLWRGFCGWLWGVAEHLLGDRRGSEQKLQDALQLSAGRAPAIASLCLAQLATLAIEEADWDRACELVDRAIAITEAHESVCTYPGCALVFAVAANVRAHQSHLDEAKRDLRRGIDLLASFGDFMPWYGAETRIMLARAALRLADTLRARTLLAEASRFARKTPDATIFRDWLDHAWEQIDALAETALSGPSSLTIAELRILRFMPTHRSFREIAERLGVSVNTVKTQAHAIYRKLDATGRSDAVARAARAGLLGT